jgi:hypothetical protein
MERLRGLDHSQEMARRIVAAFDDVAPLIAKDIRTEMPLVHLVRQVELPARVVTQAEYEAAKKVCDGFPGLMSGPAMSRQPGGNPSVKLYLDYQRFLKEGPGAWEVRHAALAKPVTLEHPYDPQYRGGGDGALTDGARAAPDYRDPAWQGYWESDLVATIDLGRSIMVRQIVLGCLQQTAAGIFLPSEVRFEVSIDGREFRPAGTVRHEIPLREAGPLVHRFTLNLSETEARFVRVTARNVGRIPDWHVARGQKAWLSADEIEVNPMTIGTR